MSPELNKPSNWAKHLARVVVIVSLSSATLYGSLIGDTINGSGSAQAGSFSLDQASAIVGAGVEFTGTHQVFDFDIAIEADFSSEVLDLTATYLSGTGGTVSSVRLEFTDLDWQDSPGVITGLVDLGGDALILNESFTDDSIMFDFTFNISSANPVRSASLQIEAEHVPEPSALAFILSGLLALASRSRCRWN